MPRVRYASIAGLLLGPLCLPAAIGDVIVPDDYDTIQEAIAAIAADPELDRRIIVEPGTYRENITLIEDLSVRGRETARTFLEGGGDQPVVTINGVDNVDFANFTLTEGNIGVQVDNSLDVTISNNVFDLGGSATGVEVIDDSDVVVSNNTFWENGTAVSRTQDLTEIKNNIFARNALAIRSDGDDAEISFNCFFENINTDTLGSDSETAEDVLFVDTDERDFHLREDSDCIDVGAETDTDVIDGSRADAGAYGGSLADTFPFPVPQPDAVDTSAGSSGPFSINVSWSANRSYLVTNSSDPGGYDLYYDSDASGPPYDGTDAGSGDPDQASPIDVGNVTSFTLDGLSPDVTSAPETPTLLSVEPGNQRLRLRWTAVDGATRYNVHWGVASTSENTLDVGNVTSFELSGLENGVTYQLAVSAVAQATYYIAVKVYDSTASRHESVFSPEATVSLGESFESGLSNELTGIPEEVVPFPDLPDNGTGCFIATAAYGGESAPSVLALRDFRDRYLITNAPGRAVVDAYYATSPPLARYLDAHPELKPVVRVALYPLVAAALFVLEAATGPKLLIATLVALLVGRRLGRRLRLVYGLKWVTGRFKHAMSGGLGAVMLGLTSIGAVFPDTCVGEDEPTVGRPHWSFEFKGGLFYPDEDDWDEFYGDDYMPQIGASIAYKFLRQVEVGVGVDYMWDEGEGELPLNDTTGGEVDYKLVPVHLFVLFRGVFDEDQWLVPYIGGGWTRALYWQEIEDQDNRNGHEDGWHLRGGLQLLLDSFEPGRARAIESVSGINNTYLFLEAQTIKVDVDNIDLGGQSYLLGVLVEF